jgi:hypothetical protein
MKRCIVFSLLAFCVFMSACASSVQHRPDAAVYHYGGEKFSKVDLTVDPKATEDPNDLVRFENQKLQQIIERNLEASELVDKASLSMVKVVITDIRVRSTFNAFMWGFMAGNDHIVGDVSLIGEKGEPRHTFKVSASYALGGLAGMNETRMGWLYEEFAKLTLKEIKGGSAEGKE